MVWVMVGMGVGKSAGLFLLPLHSPTFISASTSTPSLHPHPFTTLVMFSQDLGKGGDGINVKADHFDEFYAWPCTF